MNPKIINSFISCFFKCGFVNISLLGSDENKRFFSKKKSKIKTGKGYFFFLLPDDDEGFQSTVL